MLKIDRSEVDKVIKSLVMYTATEEVLADYEAEKKVLVVREEALAERLAELQEQHTQTLMDRELSKDNPSDYIYLSKQLVNTNDEVKVLLSLQEQQNDEFKTLKENYMPLIRETYSRDTLKKDTFNVSAAVDSVRDQLKQIISDYESEIYKQEQHVMPVISKDFLNDSDLMNENWDDPIRRKKALAFKRAFEYEKTQLRYNKEIKL